MSWSLTALRLHLRDLRKSRGPFRCEASAQAETARLLKLLPQGTLERTVFELAEVQHVSYKAIAARLGISERHLYRVRRAMLERLCAGEAHIQSCSIVPAAMQRLEAARDLRKYGHAQRCVDVTSEILSQGCPPEHTVRTLTLRAMALSELARTGDAQRALEEAHRCAHGADPAQRETMKRMLGMTAAYMPYHDGFSDRAISLTDHTLRGATASSSEPFERRELIRDFIFAGIQHQEAGSPLRALDFLQRALALSNQLPMQPAAEVAQIYIHSAFARSSLANQSAQAREDALAALQIAQWHHLIFEEIWAKLVLGVLCDIAAKPQEGLPYVRDAAQTAESALDGDPLIRTLFLTARVEGAAGNIPAALRRIESAKPLAKTHGLLAAIVHVAAARAERQQGNASRTIMASTRAIHGIEGRALTHYLGIPYLARALARHRLGDVPADDVERATYYLQRGGSLADQADAMNLSYQLTRNRRQLDLALQLRNAAQNIA
ncbi:MAG TPA: sigma-70 region 4 domain-containing protein [Candidatus Baltobacteraceae bacterium]|jgi:tetratricopeptide (TPR) repeat protein|nr:sigma-70 region 4 domain-containing protein [Candidatus Baltobacteraceae bacterium]